TVPMSDSFMSHRNVRGRGGDLVTFLAPLQIMSYMQWADVVFGPRAPSAGPPALRLDRVAVFSPLPARFGTIHDRHAHTTSATTASSHNRRPLLARAGAPFTGHRRISAPRRRDPHWRRCELRYFPPGSGGRTAALHAPRIKRESRPHGALANDLGQ